MSECYQHEKMRRAGSPCPYCRIAELEAQITKLNLLLMPDQNQTAESTANRVHDKLAREVWDKEVTK